MAELRLAVDEMETLTSRACWPYPTYGELLFSVRFSKYGIPQKFVPKISLPHIKP